MNSLADSLTRHYAPHDLEIAVLNALVAAGKGVLKPGGVLASYDILSGTGGKVYYPLPWARDSATSFLVSPKQMSDVLENVGFEVEYWQDTTAAGRSWFKRMGDKLRNQGVLPLGLHILLGADFQVMAQNQLRNLEEDRISLIEAVVRRPVGL